MALERAFISELTLDIYLIGYKTEGESIVAFIKSDGEVCYSIVVDSYKGIRNETIEILNANNVDYVNLFCWTHPHKDHSRDLKSILEKCNESTKYLLADGLASSVDEFNNNIKEIYLEVDNIIRNNKNKFIDVEYVKGTNNNIINRSFVTHSSVRRKYPFKIDVLAPIPNLIEKRRVFNRDGKDINLYSIALLITLGKFHIFLGGDVQDEYYFDLVKEEHIPQKIDYIKIPHHGSKHSKGIFNWLKSKNKCKVACSTTKNSKTPDLNTLIEYLKYTNKLWCTKDVFDDSNNDDNIDHGIIHTYLDITKRIIETDRFSGNAMQITKKHKIKW